MKNKLISVVLILALSLTMVLGSAGTVSAAAESNIRQAFNKCGDYIYETVSNPVCDSAGGDWAMYGFGQAGYPVSEEYIAVYKTNVENAVKKGYRGVAGQLHDRKYTEYSRVIVAYTSIGLDPTDIAGYNMVEKLADFDKVVWQGINGPVWALRALDSGNYKIPAVSGIKNVTTRQKLIDYIINAQLSDGGWNLNVSNPEAEDFEKNKKLTNADPDVTGMALTALAPYRNRQEVKKSIDKAVRCLSEMQNADGGFEAWGTASSESISQVICGLTSVGINPGTDRRFKKNGKSLVDALLDFYDSKSGGFRHVNKTPDGYKPADDQIATEQAYYALAAYFNTVPAAAVVSKVSELSGTSLKVYWKKAESGSACSGYQITAATDSGFKKGVKKTFVAGKNRNSAAITGLKKGSVYYVKVRAYKKVNGVKVYGAYSKVKKVKLH